MNRNASRALSKHSSRAPPCETWWTSPQWLKQIISTKNAEDLVNLYFDSRSMLLTSCSSLEFIPWSTPSRVSITSQTNVLFPSFQKFLKRHDALFSRGCSPWPHPLPGRIVVWLTHAVKAMCLKPSPLRPYPSRPLAGFVKTETGGLSHHRRNQQVINHKKQLTGDKVSHMSRHRHC
jgi:hypothetical protein